METIREIREAVTWGGSEWSQYEGFEVQTDEQVIRIGISNGQSCCENWGYFASEDNFAEFIGATIANIAITDTALNTRVVEQREELYLDEGDIMFVTVNTSNGPLQFVAYNSHNGYYGHTAVVESRQLQHEETL